MRVSPYLPLTRLAAAAVLAAGLAASTGHAQHMLTIQQIGENQTAKVAQHGSDQRAEVVQESSGQGANRAMLVQGRVPSAEDAAELLGLDAAAPLFRLRDAGTLGGITAVLSEDASLGDLLGDLEGASAGTGNVAELRQTGTNNRALAVQMGGQNRMLTEQHGDGNIGLHLQRGSGNDTELVQRNGGNVNALLAGGGAAGNDGGPLRLEAMGDVKGFSIRASGPQTYSTATVARNATGGLDITLKAR